MRAARPKANRALCSLLYCVLVVRSTLPQDSDPGLDLAVESVGDPRHPHAVVVQAGQRVHVRGQKPSAKQKKW